MASTDIARHVSLHTPAMADLINPDVILTDSAIEAVRLSFNPSKLPEVDKLKTLAAAFLSQCETVATQHPDAGRELAVAKTHMQTASMWAVLGATKGL